MPLRGYLEVFIQEHPSDSIKHGIKTIRFQDFDGTMTIRTGCKWTKSVTLSLPIRKQDWGIISLKKAECQPIRR